MTYTSDERLCVNADKSAIVDCESPEAAYQLAPAGGEVSDADVKKYGLSKGKTAAKPEPDVDEVVETPEEKAVASPPANKAKNGGANK